MSSSGLNKWIVSGYLAADADIKTVDLKNGERAKVAKATIYVRKVRNREESFTVSLSIWEGASAWRKLPFLKKGSLIICTGGVEPYPYLSNSDNLPRAGLSMNVLDIDLDSVRFGDNEEVSGTASQEVIQQTSDLPISGFANQHSPTSKNSEKVATRTQTTKVLVEEDPSGLGKQSKEEIKAPAKA
jgi:single-stranded DNA-binding protein